MTALSNQCEVIRGWLNLGPDVYPDSVVTSWIRMAEDVLSKRLRIKDMLQIDTGRLVDQRYLLPNDCRELNFIRVIGGRPLRYVPRDDFYNPEKKWWDDQINAYTLAGNYLITGVGTPATTEVEITYYQDVPALGDATNWLYTQYPTLCLVTTLHMASMYSIEDERGPLWEGQSDKIIQDLNIEHIYGKASGSRLTSRHRQVRSFG